MDPFWFKVIFVVAVIIAQGVLWSWVILTAQRRVPGWSVRGLMGQLWMDMKLQSARVLAAVDRTLKVDRRRR